MQKNESRRKEVVKHYKENFEFSKDVWTFYRNFGLILDRDEKYYEEMIAKANELIARHTRRKNDPRKTIIIAVIQALNDEDEQWKEDGI